MAASLYTPPSSLPQTPSSHRRLHQFAHLPSLKDVHMPPQQPLDFSKLSTPVTPPAEQQPHNNLNTVDWLDTARTSSSQFFAEKTCEMICYLWFDQPQSPSSSPQRNATSPMFASPSAWTHRLHPSAQFITYMSNLLSTTQVSQSVIVLSLHYIHKLKGRHRFSEARPGSEFRIAVTGLMMANKFLDDNTYTNATWSSISSISLTEINRMEIEFLDAVGWSLYVDERTYESWLLMLKGLVAARVKDAATSVTRTSPNVRDRGRRALPRHHHHPYHLQPQQPQQQQQQPHQLHYPIPSVHTLPFNPVLQPPPPLQQTTQVSYPRSQSYSAASLSSRARSSSPPIHINMGASRRWREEVDERRLKRKSNPYPTPPYSSVPSSSDEESYTNDSNSRLTYPDDNSYQVGSKRPLSLSSYTLPSSPTPVPVPPTRRPRLHSPPRQQQPQSSSQRISLSLSIPPALAAVSFNPSPLDATRSNSANPSPLEGFGSMTLGGGGSRHASPIRAVSSFTSTRGRTLAQPTLSSTSINDGLPKNLYFYTLSSCPSDASHSATLPRLAASSSRPPSLERASILPGGRKTRLRYQPLPGINHSGAVVHHPTRTGWYDAPISTEEHEEEEEDEDEDEDVDVEMHHPQTSATSLDPSTGRYDDELTLPPIRNPHVVSGSNSPFLPSATSTTTQWSGASSTPLDSSYAPAKPATFANNGPPGVYLTLPRISTTLAPNSSAFYTSSHSAIEDRSLHHSSSATDLSRPSAHSSFHLTPPVHFSHHHQLYDDSVLTERAMRKRRPVSLQWDYAGR